jgi:hypothetical protein
MKSGLLLQAALKLSPQTWASANGSFASLRFEDFAVSPRQYSGGIPLYGCAD